MASEDTPEVGDQVSWQYSSAHPTGELAEKKTEGDLVIQSKRGNTIKRKGSPSDPAVHVARDGNDVVKKQSEVEVEEKGSGNATDGAMSKAEESKADEDKDVATNGEKAKSPAGATPAKSPKKGEKRKAEEEAEKEAPAKKGRGRPKMSEKDKEAKKAEKKVPEKKAPKEKVDKEKPADEKKGRGRPKKDASAPATKKANKPAGAAAKKMKPKAPPVKGSMGTRTRSSK